MSRKSSELKAAENQAEANRAEANQPDANQPDANIVDAAEKTGLLIRSLQSRLRDWPSDPSPEPMDETLEEETPEDLEKQLQELFGRLNAEGSPTDSVMPADNVMNDIRSRVIEGVVDRIMLEWERPQQGPATQLQAEVIERLISRVIERLSASRE
jgi:hypothetical protein